VFYPFLPLYILRVLCTRNLTEFRDFSSTVYSECTRVYFYILRVLCTRNVTESRDFSSTVYSECTRVYFYILRVLCTRNLTEFRDFSSTVYSECTRVYFYNNFDTCVIVHYSHLKTPNLQNCNRTLLFYCRDGFLKWFEIWKEIALLKSAMMF
jgi:hypothetical protein